MQPKSNTDQLTEHQKQRIVVLGAGGFLGRAMANHLVAKGYSVIAGLWDQSEETPNTDCLYGDVNDRDFLDQILANANVVYHFAGSTNPQTNKTSLGDELEQTLIPLMRIIDSCKKNKVGKIVYPSSGGTVYRKDAPVLSETSPLYGETPYANCKITSEFILRCASESGDLSATVFRVGNPYGPGQIAKPGQGVIAHWIGAIKGNQPITIFGNERVSRDFIFIDDVCELMELSADMNQPFEVFNVGSGIATSLKQIYETLESELGKSLEINAQESRPSDRDTICLNVDKILKYKPGFKFTSLEQGLRKTLLSWGLSLKS